MQQNARKLMLWGGTTVLMLAVAGTAWGQKTTVKGLIVGRNGPDMIIQGQNGNVTVTLNDFTKVEEVKGLFGIRHSELGMTALVPGLPVEVQGEQSGSKLLATVVKFKASDLQTANQIQAGLTPTDQQLSSTEQQVQSNQQQIQAQQQQRNRGAAGQSHQVRKNGEEEQHEHGGRQPRSYQLAAGIGAEGAHRVDLFGHLHGAQFGRHAAGVASGHHQAGEHGTQLAHHRHGNQLSGEGECTEARQ